MLQFDKKGLSPEEAFASFIIDYAGAPVHVNDYEAAGFKGYGVEDAIESSNPRGWCRDVSLEVGPFNKTQTVALNVARTGYKMPARFNKLISDYLPADWWIKRDAKGWKTGGTQKWAFSHKMGHTNGGCLQTFTAAREGRTLRAAAFSRTAYIAPVGVIDFSLLNLMCQNLINRYPTLFDNYTLTWNLAQAQWRPWMTRPYLQSTGIYDQIREQHPDCWMSKMWDWMESVRETPMVTESSYMFFRNWVYNRHPSAHSHPDYYPVNLHKLPVQQYNAMTGINPDPKFRPSASARREIAEAKAHDDDVAWTEEDALALAVEEDGDCCEICGV